MFVSFGRRWRAGLLFSRVGGCREGVGARKHVAAVAPGSISARRFGRLLGHSRAAMRRKRREPCHQVVAGDGHPAADPASAKPPFANFLS